MDFSLPQFFPPPQPLISTGLCMWLFWHFHINSNLNRAHVLSNRMVKGDFYNAGSTVQQYSIIYTFNYCALLLQGKLLMHSFICSILCGPALVLLDFFFFFFFFSFFFPYPFQKRNICLIDFFHCSYISIFSSCRCARSDGTFHFTKCRAGFFCTHQLSCN